jgi:hypothetical protein
MFCSTPWPSSDGGRRFLSLPDCALAGAGTVRLHPRTPGDSLTIDGWSAFRKDRPWTAGRSLVDLSRVEADTAPSPKEPLCFPGLGSPPPCSAGRSSSHGRTVSAAFPRHGCGVSWFCGVRMASPWGCSTDRFGSAVIRCHGAARG